jgi:hypothetical protein
MDNFYSLCGHLCILIDTELFPANPGNAWIKLDFNESFQAQPQTIHGNIPKYLQFDAT